MTHFSLQQFLQNATPLIVGKQREFQLALCCILARGHLLIEDLPGMGKTSFVLVLSHLLDLSLHRIQFTNDLLPADILGLSVLSEDRKSFHFHPGPIFSNLVLADELNRGNPKTQSALLQAMEERSVTVDGTTRSLPNPFFLIATQNPSEHAGTYLLPESQLDRFMMRIEMGYPQQKDEIEILKNGDVRFKINQLKPLLTQQDLLAIQQKVDNVHVSTAIIEYVQTLLQKTRGSISFKMGLSPRCGLLLLQAAKAWAYLDQRELVVPDDIQAIFAPIVHHRLQIQRGDTSSVRNLVEGLIKQTPIPL